MRTLSILLLVAFSGCSVREIELPENIERDSCSARVHLGESYTQLGPTIDLYFEKQEFGMVVVGISPIVGRELLVKLSDSGIVEEKVSPRFGRSRQRELVSIFLLQASDRSRKESCKLSLEFPVS